MDFGQGAQKSIQVRAKSGAGSLLEIRLDGPDGPLLGTVKVGKTADWQLSSAVAKNMPKGVHDIVVTQTGGKAVEVDWLSFQ